MHARCILPGHWNSHKCKYMSHVYESPYDIFPRVADVLSFFHSFHHAVHVSIYCIFFKDT